MSDELIRSLTCENRELRAENEALETRLRSLEKYCQCLEGAILPGRAPPCERPALDAKPQPKKQ